MVIDGNTIIDKNLVTVPDDLYNVLDQIQPNGVDLRVDKIWEVTGKGVLEADSKMNYKQMQKREAFYKEGYYALKPHIAYAIDFRERISVPDGYCAIVYPRSSLLRVGAFVTSALWDTGFQGQLGGFLRALNPIDIALGARLAQVVFTQSKFSGLRYNGRYQGTTSQVTF